MKISIFINGIPKGQPRPRAFSRGGKARVYDPGTAEAWKGAIALAIRPHAPAQPIEGPVSIEIDHFMPRPRAHFRTGKRASELREDAPRIHASKPDVDNLLKAAMDALTQIGIWRDDDQVARCYVTKRYANGQPGAQLKIQTL